jgi:4-amino-4-deoxy-L-arabinose transferase-like glycosyltransferase
VNPTSSSATREHWAYCGLALLLALLWLATLGSRPLFNPDEGRYAEIPREMLSGGDWVIPHLNGLAYIEKPPLQYWATAISYRLLGTNEFAARLYTALTALGTAFMVWLVACRLWSPAAGSRAVAVLAGMLMFVILGQLLTLDMSLTFYLTLSLGGFLLAQQATRPRLWMLLAWAGAALGVLTKGLVAAAIPVAVLILYSLYARDFTPWRRLCIAWGLPLFLAISVPWHWLAERRLAGFLEFYFIHEHVARYLTPVSDRQEPWWFFAGVFLAGSMPWTLSALRVLAGGWRRRAPAGGALTRGASGGSPASTGASGTGPPSLGREFQPALFLWIWVVFIGVFFSLSDSKLMPYILPLMPALALAIAALPAPALKRDFMFTAILTLIAGLGLAVAGLRWAHIIAPSERGAYFLLLASPLKEIALLLTVSGAFVLTRCARDATRAGVFLGVGWCLAWLLLVRAAALVAPVYSGSTLAAALPESERDVPFYSVGTYDQSLTFYLRRTVTLVAYRGELDYGLKKTPDAAIGTLAEFIPRWSSQPVGLAVMEKSMFDDLKSRGVPMRKIGQDFNRVVVARQ